MNRPFKKRQKNYNFKKNIKKVRLIHPSINFSLKRLWIFLLLVIFSYWTFFIINNTLFKSENYIKQVFYSQASVDNYDSPYLYKKISSIIKDENYFVVSKLRRRKIQKEVQQEFPMVKSIKFVQSQKFAASVWIDFYYPDIVLKLWDRSFAVLWDYDFEIFSGNTIWDSVFSVDLPQYLSGISSLHGLFFEISPKQLIQDMEIISQGFNGYTRIVYLPGSSMTLVFIWEKRIYLNNKNSLPDQINNYNMLMKFYDKGNSLKVVDLGSLDLDKIIVR